jgi:Cyclin M transmembrane N-terminal domain
VPALAPHAETIALAVVVMGITFLSLILGELVPKRIALRNPEGGGTGGGLCRPKGGRILAAGRHASD